MSRHRRGLLDALFRFVTVRLVLTEPIAERFDPHEPRRAPPAVERGLDRPDDRRARQPGIGASPATPPTTLPSKLVRRGGPRR